ncbi:MAG: DUF2927 domain-containing protein [Alphaproteobacteria bacterium]|nr:DUF2927 domain-containing protein [Alphaproteobacteria bacterium]MBT7943625.1 DUF2927 domain-containing protein [Alphaproteobacteria bacterium]
MRLNFVKSRRWSIGLAALLVTAMLIPVTSSAGERLSNSEIVRNFNIIAFGNEYTQHRYERIRKWRKPVVARIDGNPPAYFEDFVRQHLRDLSKITGHPLKLAYSARMRKEKRIPKGLTSKSFNMFLLFYPMAKMTTVVRKQLGTKMDPSLKRLKRGASTCEAQVFKKGDEIRTAVILFPAYDDRKTLRACVVEELTQVMGLINDSNRVQPSIFNDTSQFFELTGHDRLLLRILYDARIPVAMPRRDAMRAAHTILNEIRPR